MQSDFRSIVQDLSKIETNKISIKEVNDFKILKFIHLSDKYFYFYRSNFDVFRIYKKAGFFKTINVSIVKNSEDLLDSINISHSRIRLSINLKLIKVQNNAN